MNHCDLDVRSEFVAPARGLVASVVCVLGAAALVTLGAQIRIPVPFSDVPMTLQVLAVLLVGFLLPRNRATAAIALYLVCGAAGLPVFTAGSGGLLGSTGGYLAGFLVAAWMIPTLLRAPDAGFARLLLVGSLGLMSIFTLGTAWRIALVLTLGWFDGRIGWAIATGLTPFLLKAVVELSLAAALAIRIRSLMRTRDR